MIVQKTEPNLLNFVEGTLEYPGVKTEFKIERRNLIKKICIRNVILLGFLILVR